MQHASEPLDSTEAAASHETKRFRDANTSRPSPGSDVGYINSGDEVVVERPPSSPSSSVPSTHLDFSENDTAPSSQNALSADSMARQHRLTALEKENIELRERLVVLERSIGSKLSNSQILPNGKTSPTPNGSTVHASEEERYDDPVPVDGAEAEVLQLRSRLGEAERRLATQETETLEPLKQERDQLLQDKENYLRINRTVSTELENLRTELEDLRADNEALRSRSTDAAEELQNQRDQTREAESERRATARTCNMLAEELMKLKENTQELEKTVQDQIQTIETLKVDLERASEISHRAQDCNCLENGILRALELEHEVTRKKLQDCTAELRQVQGQQGAVRRKCDDLREEVHNLRQENTTTTNKTFRFDDLWGSLPGPSGVNHSPFDFATIAQPVKIAYSKDSELVRMVHGLNEHVELIATTIVSLTDSDKPLGMLTPGKEAVHTHIRNRLQDILGEDLFQSLRLRTQQETRTADLHEVAWAIQAALSYLLEVYAKSWPQSPPLLLEDQTDWNRWQRQVTVGKRRESQQSDHRVRADMVSKTMLHIDEILALSGLLSVGDLEDTRQRINDLWNEAEKVASYLKEPSKDASYELLLATPGEPFDGSKMVLDEPDLGNQSMDSRTYLIVVVCTKALGLVRVTKGGKARKVLEKVRIVQGNL